MQAECYEEYTEAGTPGLLSPVYVHNGTVVVGTGTAWVAARTSHVVQTAQGTCIRKSMGLESNLINLWFILVMTIAVVLLT